jgi:hypothetical protein
MNKQAVATAVPVLNQNRLLTLIGRASLDVNR